MRNTGKINKRIESNKLYVDALQEQYSKLNNVRVDLAYKSNSDVTLEEASNDVNRLLNNRRSKPSVFEDNVGYILKKEYTEEKGVHIHAFFMFDGQKVQKSAYKANQIGKYWVEKIAKDKGTYHNCHRNKYKRNGIGMLEHNDDEKRKYLDEAIEYVCKDEQSIESISTKKKDRAVTRGTIPKKKGSKMGRPRSSDNDTPSH